MRHGIAVSLAGVLVFAATAAAAPARNGLIAFTTTVGPDGGGKGVVAVAADGSFRGRVFTSPANPDGYGPDIGGEWSPDGRRYAGSRLISRDDERGSYTTVDLFVIDADGSHFRWLTQTRNYEHEPRWSPNGRSLIYTVEPADPGTRRIDAIGSDGRSRRVVLDTAEEEFEPDWSPDGRRIVFRRLSIGAETDDLWTARTDGTDPRQLTSTRDPEAQPQWSPDGQQIAYVHYSQRSSGPLGLNPDFGGDIWLIRADGSDARRLTTDPFYAARPAWSPDGRRIAFVSARDAKDPSYDNTEIYTIAIDGSDETRVTTLAGADYVPSWAPVVTSARIEARRAVVSGGRARVIVSCFALAPRNCRGRVVLVRRGDVLARGVFRARKGQRVTAKAPLTRRGRAITRSRRRVLATAKVSAGGERSLRKVTLRRR